MSTMGEPVTKTYPAGSDLSAKQFYFVKLSSGNLALCDTAGEQAIGVLQDAPSASGRSGSVAVLGRTKVIAGAAVSAGARVKTDTAGKAITATAATVNTSDTGASSDAVVGSNALGVALTAAGADGDIIEILLVPMGAIPTTAA